MWVIRDLDDLDREIRIGDDSYLLLFPKTTDEYKAVLRIRSTNVARPTLDIFLHCTLS